jgi:hypothetical protein
MRKTALLVSAAAFAFVAAWLAMPFVKDRFGKEPLRPEALTALVNKATQGASAGTVVVEQVPAAPIGGEAPHPPGDVPIAADLDGEAVWLAGGSDRTILRELLRWEPATGNALRYRVSNPSMVFASDWEPSIVATPFGLLILGGKFLVADQWQHDGGRLVLLNTSNQVVTSRLRVGRERPYFLVLRDKSVIVASGVKISTNAVERISSRYGELTVEELPDLPGEYRRGVSLVELSDGRVMALGGSTSQYIGTEPILADTFILDLAAKTWSAGPKMIEARTNATATLLPDGSVLVAGGWAIQHTWNDGPTRSTERLSPSADRFSPGAQLALGVASHRAIWAQGQQGKQLLLVGGIVQANQGNRMVQSYDVAAVIWRSVGEPCSADDKSGDVITVPFSFGGRRHLWCKESGFMTRGWSLVSLRLPSSGTEDALQRIDTKAGVALRREGVAFLPPQGDAPGLAVGGSVNGAPSAAVDAIWSDGRIQSLASLNDVRANAQVFRLKDGSFLVEGGVSGQSARRTQRVAPTELLPAGAGIDKARWLGLNLETEDGARLGQLGDGSLLAVGPGDHVERVTVTGAAEGKPAIQRTSLPSLSRNRRSSWSQSGATLVVKQLSDGQIVVAGGEEQRHRIAVMHQNAMNPDSPDQFVGIGDYTPASTHEIYHPAAKVWRQSAPSRGAGRHVAILDDGRVVKWGEITAETPPAGANAEDPGSVRSAVLEISSADGRSWREFATEEAPLITTHMVQRPARPFVVQGELFLFGMHLTDVTPNYARGNQMLQWFNTVSRRWVTLWEAPEDDWRNHLGRVIVRDLPGGKRVALPVAGP